MDAPFCSLPRVDSSLAQEGRGGRTEGGVCKRRRRRGHGRERRKGAETAGETDVPAHRSCCVGARIGQILQTPRSCSVLQPPVSPAHTSWDRWTPLAREARLSRRQPRRHDGLGGGRRQRVEHRASARAPSHRGAALTTLISGPRPVGRVVSLAGGARELPCSGLPTSRVARVPSSRIPPHEKQLAGIRGGRWASGTPRATPTSSLAEKGARDPALRQLRARPPTPSLLLTSPGGREAEGEPSRCDIPIRRDRQSPLLLEERRPCPAGLPRALRGYARPYRSNPRYRRAPVHASIASGVPTLTGGTAPRALSLLRTRGLELPMQTRQPPPPGPRPPLRQQRDAQRRLVIGRLSCSSSSLPPLRFWPGGFLSSAHDDMSWERASQMGSPDTPRPSPRPCSGSAENTTADRPSGGSAAPEAQPAASRFRPRPLRLC